MVKRPFPRPATIWAIAFTVLLAASPARAATIAVFGDNGIDDYLNGAFGAGSATLVSDAQLATPGFLNAFDAFLYTRSGSSFCCSLSAGAAAQVSAYATGNFVLLNGDFADSIPADANIDTLLGNAFSYATAGGHGYIGEFNGAAAALTSNANGYTPLDLISGAAGPFTAGGGGSNGSIVLAAAGVGHPVLAGVGLPYNPAAVEVGAVYTGVNPAFVLATWGDGSPAIVAGNADVAAVPEPASLFLFGSGLAGLAARRKKRA